MADVESDIKQDNSIKNPQCAEQRHVRAAPNVPRLIQCTAISQRQAEKLLVMVNAMETRRNNGVKKSLDRMHQCFTTSFMYVVQEI
jgi:hypothetical protein